MESQNRFTAGAKRAGSRIARLAVYVLLIFWALMVLFPFYWMLLTSLKS